MSEKKEYIERGALKAHYSWLPKDATLTPKDFDDIIDAQPAVDVEPVVRGEWKESFTTRDCQCATSGVSYTFWYTCSNCGKKSRTKRERCLHCFAHMERSGSGE